ncbi:MAG TPA: radical SAM protein [Pirellulales bacterium]|nr:radical SAM protein [Pirellulales bacterium]
MTEACNLGCSYCFEYGADHHTSMTLETARAAVDLLMDASRDAPRVAVTFMGGEPMLMVDLIQDVVGYAGHHARRRAKSVTFDMQTNGVLIREEHARFFRDNGVNYCLSLDGAQLTNDRHRRTLGGSGTFQIVAAKMKMLKRYQHWQGARMTITPQSAAQLGDDVRALHEDLAINQFIIGFATHVAWADREIADYAEGLMDAFDYFVEQRVVQRSRRIRIGLFELGQLDAAFAHSRRSAWGCGAGSGRLAIAPDGTLHGCSKLAWGAKGGSAAAPLPLGSVDSGFSRPENRLKLLDHSEAPRIKCHSCELAAHCNGGCHAASIADTGDMYVPADYFCKLMFAQKQACDYARRRLAELRIDSLRWDADMPDLTKLNQREEAMHAEAE